MYSRQLIWLSMDCTVKEIYIIIIIIIIIIRRIQVLVIP